MITVTMRKPYNLTAAKWSLATIGFYEIYWTLHIHKELRNKNIISLKSPVIYIVFDTVRILSFFTLLYLLFLFPQTLQASRYDPGHYRWCFITRLPEQNSAASSISPPYDVSNQACSSVFAAQASYQQKLSIAVLGRYISACLFIICCGLVAILLAPLSRGIDIATKYKGPHSHWIFALVVALAPPGLGPVILDKTLPDRL